MNRADRRKADEIAFLNSLMLEDDAPLEDNAPQPATPAHNASHTPSHTHCPEPMILWGLTQKDRVSSAMLQELRDHIATCASCAEVAQRLQGFHDAMQDQDSEKDAAAWAEVEPRLNHWMRGYLNSQPDAYQATGRPAQSRWSVASWSFPSLRWALPVALACAAGVFVVLANRHGIQPGASNDLASVPNGASPGEFPTARPSDNSDNGTVLMKDGKAADGSSEDQSPTVAFPGGERLKLLVTEVATQSDGSYRFAGKLLPGDEAPRDEEDGFDFADVTGVWVQSQLEGRLSFSIQNAVKGNANYRASVGGYDGQITAVLPEDSIPQRGRIFDIRLTQGGRLQKVEKVQP